MAADSTTAQDSESRPKEKTSEGWAQFWNSELTASNKMLRKWMKTARRTTKEFIDERQEGEDTWFKLNLFHANITTLKSMMYGNLPQVTVTRRFSDADDDIARVAGVILERMLNNDLEENGDEYDVVLRGVLEDRLVPGLGCAVVRYDMATEMIDTEVWDEDHQAFVAGQEEKLDWEDAPVDYHWWGDILWSWGRNWSELRWVAFRHHMTREKMKARFGEEKAKQATYQRQTPTPDKEHEGYERDLRDSVDKAEVWEIWDKESGTVFWHQHNETQILDEADDPLGLEGFFPCPPFFIANTTTSLYRPTPDYYMAKDLYMEVNRLETRIAMITEAVKVVGVYDKQQEGVQRMLKEGIENDLIPVDNWAMMAEKGGLQGVIDLFPALEVAQTLERLVAQRNDAINLLYQVTGMSDILRGAATEARTSATEQELKAKFASMRVQALQDAFAKFCSDLMQIKAEIICKHFDPQTIAQQANVQFLNQADQELVPQAIELLKNQSQMYFRVAIKAESVAMVDFAKKQAERTEYIQSLGFFLQSAAPIAETAPNATPVLLEMLKWGLAGFKGSDEIEGVLDKAIEDFQQNPPQEKQDNADQVEQIKMQAKMQEMQMKAEQDAQKHQFQMREIQAKHEAQMREMMAEHQAQMREIMAQNQGKVTQQAAQLEGDLILNEAETENRLREQDNAAQIQANSAE